ncbi:MAG: haloacid dehalogenase [Ectothiorhodospiraceae bacterium]|nr:haloacid dehalogenase [Ectothiorhodospiraceae bacterium]
MDGTLLDLAFDNHFWLEALPARLARERRVSLEQARGHLFPLMKQVEGTLDWYCLDYWQDRLRVDLVQLKQETAHMIGFRPGAEAFLQALNRSGKRAVLVTNAHRGSLGLKLQRVPALEGYLDEAYSSHDFGVSKEFSDFWDGVQSKDGFEPGRTVLLDDSVRVLSAARDWGVPQVFGIAQPDLSRPPLSGAEFPLIVDFQRVVPRVRGVTAG